MRRAAGLSPHFSSLINHLSGELPSPLGLSEMLFFSLFFHYLSPKCLLHHTIWTTSQELIRAKFPYNLLKKLHISRISYTVAVNDKDPVTKPIPIVVMGAANMNGAGWQMAAAPLADKFSPQVETQTQTLVKTSGNWTKCTINDLEVYLLV